MKSNLYKPTLIFLVLLFSILSAQTKSKLVPVNENVPDIIYIDQSTLKIIDENDIHVWTVQKHHIPLVIEAVDEKIYETRTNYVINKELNKYGLLEIIYYDDAGNVLKSFSYQPKTKITNFRYNFPVIPGSEMEAVEKKCEELLKL